MEDVLKNFLVAFDYDEIYYNSLNRTYELVREGEVVAELSADDYNKK